MIVASILEIIDITFRVRDYSIKIPKCNLENSIIYYSMSV